MSSYPEPFLSPPTPRPSAREPRHILTHQRLQQAVEYLPTAPVDVGQKRFLDVRMFGAHIREDFHLLFIESVYHDRPRLARSSALRPAADYRHLSEPPSYLTPRTDR